MSRVLTALEQLDRAIDRLESAVGRRLALERGERDRLDGELRSLRANHAALTTEARTVSSRLDSAIGRLRLLIEE